MKIPVIKKLVESHEIEVLTEAEQALLNEKIPVIEVEGEDEGEQLTHVLAAIEIRRNMETENLEMNTALRNYTKRVRKSIS